MLAKQVDPSSAKNSGNEKAGNYTLDYFGVMSIDEWWITGSEMICGNSIDLNETENLKLLIQVKNLLILA